VGPVLLSGVLRDLPESDELVLVVHGLGGSADSHYARRAARAADAAGLSCLRVNLRGSDRAGEDFYHAGLTADLHAALASPELARFRRLYALGYSVGGHLALRLAAEAADPRLLAVAAVCAPVDLALSAAAFDRPELWLYRRYVMNSLKEIYAAVAGRRPVPLPLVEAQHIRGLVEWDDRVVAPRHGFAGAADYYARQSVGPLLPQLRLPALLAAAQGDPMVPAETLRPALARADGSLEVRWLARGGHVGFPEGLAWRRSSSPGCAGRAGGRRRRDIVALKPERASWTRA
jgi:predicted alpha/beta-fold hydrolase